MTHRIQRFDSKDTERGVALLLALAVLSFVSVMGAAMYAYMRIESDKQSGDTNAGRASWVARSGIEAAIAKLETTIINGKLPESPVSVPVPIYKQANEEGKPSDPLQEPPILDDRYTAQAQVTISDESAKINANLAPPAVLMALLKIDGDKARQIREKLPRIDDGAASADDANRQWLTSVDDLINRQLLTSETLTPLHAADLTVYTALDAKNLSATINLNSASSAVIEAALGVTPEVAAKIIAARPITSADALKAAAGKDPSGFNFKPAPENPGALPKELSFSSRCFRLVSRGEVSQPAEGAVPALPIASATIEAVVQFPENAAPRIVYWNESASARSGK